ncbi:LutC/YkgG family protein [Sunxiuqinia sp. A32]|uniref:LutC/YkgG family protein n=1 Tax=Sunxiuqinia sp. A32 TaxID=3461496 RepID=UPI00404621CE
MGARENILNRIKKASENRNPVEVTEPDWDTPIYLEQGKDLTANFKTNLELIAGSFISCKNLDEAAVEIQKIQDDFKVEKTFLLDTKLKKAFKEKINYTARKTDFEKMQVGITPCEFLIAHLGSALISSGGDSGRRLHVFPETHIIVAHKKQLVNYLDDGIDQLQKKYKGKLPSIVTNITGPSRTADIEKTLVMGMHGPRKLFVILCDEPF